MEALIILFTGNSVTYRGGGEMFAKYILHVFIKVWAQKQKINFLFYFCGFVIPKFIIDLPYIIFLVYIFFLLITVVQNLANKVVH